MRDEEMRVEERGTRYLVWLVQRILQPFSGTTSPRCILSLQLVGPVWGHTWVPGCITENLICTHHTHTHTHKHTHTHAHKQFDRND